MKVYKSGDEYIALVLHNSDLYNYLDGSVYYGPFEYILRVGDELEIFDTVEMETVPIHGLTGINSEAVWNIVGAAVGEVPFEELNSESDYYRILESFDNEERLSEIFEAMQVTGGKALS